VAKVTGEGPSLASQPSGWVALVRILPVAVLLYATFLPPEARLVLAGQNLYAPRLASFILLPFLVQRLASRPPQIRSFDLLFLAGIVWMVLSFTTTYGLGEGFVRGGALALDILLPYLIARAFIENIQDFRRLLVLIAPGAFIVGISLFAESVSGQFLVRPAFAQVFGPLSSYEGGDASGTFSQRIEYRLGLLRAFGPFPHPIHAGLFMASMLPLFATSGLRNWPYFLGMAAAFFAFFTGSSAAYLSFFIAIGLMLYDRLRERVQIVTWPPFLLGSTLLLLALELVSKNGVIAIISRYTINPQSASYRRIIWEYGTQSVANYPFFGIGFNSWERLKWMGSTVDNYWLLLAMRHGLVVPILFLTVSLILMVRLCRQLRGHAIIDRRFETGLVIAIFLLVVMGFTVAFAGSVLCLFFLLLGAVGSIVHTPR